jgi:pilus assembly protein CpaF
MLQELTKKIIDELQRDSYSMDLHSYKSDVNFDDSSNNETDPLNHRMNREKYKVERAIKKLGLQLNPEQLTRIENEFYKTGPLESLMDDAAITEIIVNGPTKIFYEQQGRLHLHPDAFLNEITFQNFIERLCLETKTQLSVEQPVADGKFRDFRMHLVGKELTQKDSVLCLRRHPKNPWSFERLANSGWASPSQIEILKNILNEKKSFLVVGPTGAGKTSVLNACLGELSACERNVLIEDTEELYLPNDCSTRLLTRTDAKGLLPNIDQAILLKQALRMRPDRIVVGEVRGAEAKDLLMALSTGHEGSMGTLHASNPHQALMRLEMLVQLGAPFWSNQVVRRLIFLSLQYIIVVNRNHTGQRYLEGIYALTSLEDTGFLLEKL